MTQQAPKEYVITEEQIDGLVLSDSKVYKELIARNVRSRPHPAPAQTKLRMPEDLDVFWLRGHDAAIRAEAARQAREERDKELREKISHINIDDCFGEMNSDKCQSYGSNCFLCMFDSVVDSLRSTQHPGQ